MKTGFDLLAEAPAVDGELIKNLHSVMLALAARCMESAAKYAQTAGRECVTSTDMEYAMKYEAHVFFFRETLHDDVGQCRTMLEENVHVSDDDADDDDDEGDDTSTSADEFKRGQSGFCQRVNVIVDAWDAWQPSDQLQNLLKDAIDSVYTS